jgi:hypothetical protein
VRLFLLGSYVPQSLGASRAPARHLQGGCHICRHDQDAICWQGVLAIMCQAIGLSGLFAKWSTCLSTKILAELLASISMAAAVFADFYAARMCCSRSHEVSSGCQESSIV